MNKSIFCKDGYTEKDVERNIFEYSNAYFPSICWKNTRGNKCGTMKYKLQLDMYSGLPVKEISYLS